MDRQSGDALAATGAGVVGQLDLTQCQGCGNAVTYCGCPEARFAHCTHPEQAWCDCDWCRVWRGYQKASKLGTFPVASTPTVGGWHDDA